MADGKGGILEGGGARFCAEVGNGVVDATPQNGGCPSCVSEYCL